MWDNFLNWLKTFALEEEDVFDEYNELDFLGFIGRDDSDE